MKYIEVVAAVFKNDEGKIYCARRRNDGELALKWEFPGGKIEEGETQKEALSREIKEELSADILVGDFITTVKYKYNSFHITMHAYYAKVMNGELILSEHTAFEWLQKEELLKLDWAAADLPIVEILMK